MDNCFPNPCQNSGTCYDEGMDYTCTCTGDWLGQRCTDSKCCRVIIFSSGSTNFDTYHIRVWLFTTTEKNNGTKENIEIIH